MGKNKVTNKETRYQALAKMLKMINAGLIQAPPHEHAAVWKDPNNAARNVYSPVGALLYRYSWYLEGDTVVTGLSINELHQIQSTYLQLVRDHGEKNGIRKFRSLIAEKCRKIRM